MITPVKQWRQTLKHVARRRENHPNDHACRAKTTKIRTRCAAAGKLPRRSRLRSKDEKIINMLRGSGKTTPMITPAAKTTVLEHVARRRENHPDDHACRAKTTNIRTCCAAAGKWSFLKEHLKIKYAAGKVNSFSLYRTK
jgi:hypothetical protein